MYKSKYVVRHHPRTYTNVYNGMGNTCMFKYQFNRTSVIKAWVSQSVEHQTKNLKVVGSTTVGDIFSFRILSLSTRSWHVDWPHTNAIKHDIHPR